MMRCWAVLIVAIPLTALAAEDPPGWTDCQARSAQDCADLLIGGCGWSTECLEWGLDKWVRFDVNACLAAASADLEDLSVTSMAMAKHLRRIEAACDADDAQCRLTVAVREALSHHGPNGTGCN